MGLLLAFAFNQAALAADEDCGRAIAPQRCLLYRQGLSACQDLDASRRRACLADYTPSLLCHRQRDAKRCVALVAAQTSCEGESGAARRRCVDERLPAPVCGRSRAECDPQDEACAGERRRGCPPPLLLGE
ncbi:hypothetical protein C2I19_02275 [Chromobacterium alticapitis]|uniref:Uncharacterized protein n=1 Tax=Chromobacterium alticapitis TaxID=2073169 RepID=A0A2S5DKG0_9NEIS|nr:hypothetical protein C2I19_02275 [Chromobacterium alticapitis]